MTSRTHDIFAFASLMTAAVYFPPSILNLPTAIVSLIANIVGSLLPDIDQGSNKLWDLLPAGNFLGRIFKNFFFAHRTLSHSLLGAFLIIKAVFFVLPKLLNPNFISPQTVGNAIVIGYLSHLVLDSLTEEGLPLLFPLKIKFGFPPIASWRIKTGKWFEKLIVFPVIVAYIFWFAFKNQNPLVQILKMIIK